MPGPASGPIILWGKRSCLPLSEALAESHRKPGAKRSGANRSGARARPRGGSYTQRSGLEVSRGPVVQPGESRYNELRVSSACSPGQHRAQTAPHATINLSSSLACATSASDTEESCAEAPQAGP